MANAESAWQLAEQRCFEHLLAELESTDGQDGFLGELPDGIYNAWSFAVTGGNSPEQSFGVVSANMPCVSWQMAAEFVGRYQERADAQRIAGLLMDRLPAKTLTAVESFRFTSMPSLIRTEDNQYWEMTIPMEVFFRNATS